MPELPEAETIVRDLRGKVPGRIVTGVKVIWPDVLNPPTTPRNIARSLKHRRIRAVDRRAKNILIRFDEGTVLMINLGMTGRVVASTSQRVHELTHVAVRFDLDDGSAMLYDDARRFGRLEVFSPEGWIERERLFGPEPLSEDFTAAYLHAATRRSISPIRNWLLDQTKVAGVGNIYAAEALWLARVRPTRRTNTLTRVETASLRDGIRQILDAAIVARGTTLNDYRDGSGDEGNFEPLLSVYGRDGIPCKRDGAIIKRVVLTNRSAFYCPKCQK